MPIKSITRGKGQEVKVAEIVIRDFRTSPLFLPDERWILACSQYYEDIGILLAMIRSDSKLPREFFVPDLWDTSTKLPKEEKEMIRDMWHLGHDLARAAGYVRAHHTDFIRNGVGGTVFLLE